MKNILLSILLFFATVVMVLTGYSVKNMGLKKSQEGNSNCSKYILQFIDSGEPHFITQKFDFREVSDSEKQVLPEDLKNFLIEGLNGNSFSQQYKNICQGDVTTEKNLRVESQAVDLNSDGKKEEYIIMPRDVCGRDVRGASSNGDIWVIKKNANTWEIIGTLTGNCYVITKDRVNGFYTILTNWHNSSNSGAETLYTWEKDADGRYTYVDTNAKGYLRQPKR
jgi:hypothetical protein